MKTIRRLIQLGLLVSLLVLTGAAWAQDQGPDKSDPPGRVARLQYMTGEVSVQPHGADDWVQGSTNRPLTNSDNVWADKNSRAELDLGGGLMRIDSETSLTLTNIGAQNVQVQLHQGSLNVFVRHLDEGETYEVDTPNLAFTVNKAGDYRFDVPANGDSTIVTVRKGEGEATGQGPAVAVHSGEQVAFSGSSLEHQVSQAPSPDGFDEWCQVRDQHLEHSASSRYVSPDVVGSSDLDEYGSWRQTPDYGPVWVPTSVAPGWTPYGYGHWIWEDPWGWTWVDDAPWGFAPFHYGRWVNWGGYWGWAPGPYWVRPWYAPALVAWFGGPGWGVGFGFGFGGGFGWCPLGWGEPFFPWYHASPWYFRNVNITNTRITNINVISNHFFNHPGTVGIYGPHGITGMPRFATTHNGLTAASRNTLEHSLPVAHNSVHVPASSMRNATGLTHIAANPTTASRLGPNAGKPAVAAPQSALGRSVVSRNSPSNNSARNGGTQVARGPEGSASRGAATSASRASEGPASKGAAASTPRPSEGTSSSARNMPGPAGRSVPRPPQSLGNSSLGRGSNNAATASRNVPHPSSASGFAGSRSEPSRSAPTESAMNHSVPRPPAGWSGSRASEPSGNFGGRSAGTMSSPGSRSVPRPSGRVAPAPRSYSNGSSRGSYSSAYSGRGYSAPSRSYGSYGGNYHASSNYGGYHGGSSGWYHNSGGGGYHGGSSGGGGGYHASSGGGFHGGGGGGSHGGGGHAGR